MGDANAQNCREWHGSLLARVGFFTAATMFKPVVMLCWSCDMAFARAISQTGWPDGAS